MAWHSVAQNIEVKLFAAHQAYDAGDGKSAKRMISDAYFDLFEGSGMETTIALKISEERNYKLESAFGSLRNLIKKSASPTELWR